MVLKLNILLPIELVKLKTIWQYILYFRSIYFVDYSEIKIFFPNKDDNKK